MQEQRSNPRGDGDGVVLEREEYAESCGAVLQPSPDGPLGEVKIGAGETLFHLTEVDASIKVASRKRIQKVILEIPNEVASGICLIVYRELIACFHGHLSTSASSTNLIQSFRLLLRNRPHR